MNWEDLKKHVYYQDGSLRDIYVRNISSEDWKSWANFVNANFLVEFKIGNFHSSDKIHFDTVVDYWSKSDQESRSASICLGHITVKTYFFVDNELESDITPTEIHSLVDHLKLVEYLKNVSELLGRPVEMTEEKYNEPCEVLMIVKGEEVVFPWM